MNRQNNKRGIFDSFPDIVDDIFGMEPFWKQTSSFRMDIQETEKEYEIDVDLPGIKKSEINLSFKDNALHIQVEKSEKTEAQEPHYIHKERKMRTSKRVISLPNAKPETIKAKLEDGVLNIKIEKEPEVKHTINID